MYVLINKEVRCFSEIALGFIMLKTTALLKHLSLMEPYNMSMVYIDA